MRVSAKTNRNGSINRMWVRREGVVCAVIWHCKQLLTLDGPDEGPDSCKAAVIHPLGQGQHF